VATERQAILSAALPLKAVLFDVDFTLARPGPELSPDAYRRAGTEYGLDLDPALYEQARARALQGLQRHPELVHDEEIWVAFTERIVRGMGGGDSPRARECAAEIENRWERSLNFDLYDDALPTLELLRRHGLKLGLISNGARDLDEFVADHKLDVDAAVGSRGHGWTKPHPSIFRAVLDRLGVEPDEAAMVGDSPEDDIEGAQALGMRAFLLDRENVYPDHEDRLTDLRALPAAIGLTD
jgi:HAD superfamily hydrolase (TIGR01549 family)